MEVEGSSRPQIGAVTLGVEVRTSDGRVVGDVERVLVREGGMELVALVVKESRRFSGHLLAAGTALLVDELVVPVEMVRAAGADGVELRITAAEARRLPPYLSYRYATTAPGRQMVDEVEGLLGGLAAPRLFEETANKPAGELEISEGERVMLGDSGRVLGHVRGVLFDDDGDLLGAVVRPTGLLRHDVVLPRRFIARADDLVLFARLEGEDIERLPRFQPADSDPE